MQDLLRQALVGEHLVRLHGLVAAGVVGVPGGLDLDCVHPLHLAEGEHQAVVGQGEGDVRQPAVLLGKIQGEQPVLQRPALEGKSLGKGETRPSWVGPASRAFTSSSTPGPEGPR